MFMQSADHVLNSKETIHEWEAKLKNNINKKIERKTNNNNKNQ